jgi:thiol:disulfide interchange protein/DsbC/DsbD-like thiol-disulfide interchange protein
MINLSLDKPASESFVNTTTMKKIITRLLACMALSAFALPLAAWAQDSSQQSRRPAPEYVQTRLIAEQTAIKPGETLTIAIDQTISDDWHTYWVNPGDSGEALMVKWMMPEGLSAAALQWQVPSRMPIGPLLNFGYSGRNTVLTDITIPADISASDITIKADLGWLVCKEICVPEMTTLELTLPVVAPDAQVEPTNPDFFIEARSKIARPVAWPGMVQEQDGAMLLSFTVDATDLELVKAATGTFEFFPYEWGLIQNAASQEQNFDGEVLNFRLMRDTRALLDIAELKGVLAYIDANGMRKGVETQIALPAPPAAIKALAEETMATDTAAVSGISLWQALGLAFLGGIILNLMPCVFPVLSMKALSLVKMSDREHSHAVTHGVMYTTGVMVCFILIAAILIGLQQAGNQIGWGFQLQNPLVVLLLAYLLFLIGLNLSGVFDIKGGAMTNLGSKLAQKQGYAGSFFTGMLATIVATPCTAPFMGAAMGYALTQSSFVALCVFAALGFGLALPYLLLTMIPALRRSLPRPGAWMETFRQFLAFPMYASAAWLVWVYGQQADGVYGVLLAGIGLVFIAMGIWMWQKAPARHPANAVVKVLSIACFGVAMAIVVISMARPLQTLPPADGSAPPATIQHSGIWTPYTKAALDASLAGNDPVFVNMTASWCITCKVNERIALATEATQALFKDQKVQYLIGDWTNQNPEITAYLKSYGRTGVPLYVYYGSRDLTTNTRPDPVVLPQLLTPGLIEDIVTYN